MIRRPPRSTLSSSSAASDVYKRQVSTQSTGIRPKEHTGILYDNKMNSLTLKCKLSATDDLRRRTISIDDGFGIDALRTSVRELFQLREAENFTLLWRDEDEDLVTVDSDADVNEAVRCSALQNKTLLRLEVRMEEASTNEGSANTTAPAPNLRERAQSHAAQISAQIQSLIPHLESNMNHLAKEFEKHAPAFEKHAQEMARQLNAHVKENMEHMQKHMPEEFSHKAHGLSKLLKKAKKKGKKLHMKFVADCSLPDGTELMPGDAIAKTWQVVNSGKDQWPDNTRLQHVGSDLFEGTEASEVPCLQPGEETQLSLNNMITPNEPGRYMSHWRLATSEGNKFGDRLWFDVTVLNPEDSQQSPPVVHLNIVCDATGMSPIVGPRYHKFLHDYDICQAAYEQLDEAQKSEFVLIDTPEDAARVAEQEAEQRAQKADTQSADEAFQLCGEQEHYDRVMAVPAGERPAELDLLRSELSAAPAEQEEEQEVHANIWCDGCNMHPVVGPRYMQQRQGDTYDLCQACYVQLDDHHKTELHLVQPKPAEPVQEPETPVEAEAEPVPEEEPVVLEFSDLSASCMADIEAAFQAEADGEAATQQPEEEEAARAAALAEHRAEREAAMAAARAEEDAARARAAAEEEEAIRAQIAADEAVKMAAKEAAAVLAAEQAAAMAAAEQARAAAEAAEQARAAAEAAEVAAIAEAEEEAAAIAAAEQEATARAAAEEVAAARAASRAAARAAAEQEEAAARAATAEAAKPQEFPLEWQGVADALVNMGFSSELARQVTTNAQGQFDPALEAALAYVPAPPPPPPPAALVKITPAEMEWEASWDYLLEELFEMGFEDQSLNKQKVAEHKGDLKSTVTALVTQEREARASR
eukprot:TRINITY_DN276_c0_g1_i6.p1 TRINITY_DN276_c0_g1~~TRINITY_DN276_c0_g1_i6.p1  ORF type:complete len:872 (-),score=380.13 TRINITY_DN276_c0_g1_i6:206-2821(-)